MQTHTYTHTTHTPSQLMHDPDYCFFHGVHLLWNFCFNFEVSLEPRRDLLIHMHMHIAFCEWKTRESTECVIMPRVKRNGQVAAASLPLEPLRETHRSVQPTEKQHHYTISLQKIEHETRRSRISQDCECEFERKRDDQSRELNGFDTSEGRKWTLVMSNVPFPLYGS